MFLYFVILGLAFTSQTTLAEDVIVELPDGTILGRTDESYSGTPYYTFQKIPYAAPPVGELRFKPPVPPEKWKGTLNTTYLDKICYQVTTNLPEESEDCLYINVYTPALPSAANDALPVYLYIYGGGFTEGHAMTYRRGPEYLIDYDIIIVTFNYRLGPLGFMSTEDTVIPGNIGLKDQQLALKWVQNNIQYFGGDPTKVTINGESAGGMSVSYHLLNKNSEGLFRAAMMESGTAIMSYALQKNARETAFKFASLLNDTFVNNTDDSEALLQFLQTVPAEDLDRISEQVFGWSTIIEVEHEDAFITEKMYGLIRDGNFVQVPLLIGLNSEEELQMAASDLDVLKAQLEIFDNNLETLVPDEVAALLNDDRDKTFGQAIRQIYCGNGTFTENLAKGVRYQSDNSFNRAIIRTAEMKSQYVDVYFYQFSYDGPLGNVTLSLEGADKVAHAEELRYIWRTTRDGYDNSDLSKYPEADVLAQQRMLKLWTNFVKTLNPTPEQDELLQNVTWPVATSSNNNIRDFLYIDIGENLEIKNHPKEDTYQRWIELYAMLGYDDFATF